MFGWISLSCNRLRDLTLMWHCCGVSSTVDSYKAVHLKSSKPDAMTTLLMLRQALEMAASGPIPGLNVLPKLAVLILNAALEAHSTKDTCLALAQRVAIIVSALHTKLITGRACQFPLDRDMWANLEAFIKTLMNIQTFMEDCATWKWYKLVLKYRSMKRDINRHSHSLDDYCHLFQIVACVDLRIMMSQMQYEIMTCIQNSSRRQNEEVQTFAEGRVVATRTFAKCHHSDVHYAELDREKPVMIKIYHQDAVPKFEQELIAYRAMKYPHVPQLLGRSPSNAAKPYVILTDVKSQDVVSFVQSTLKRNLFHGYITTLQMLQGIASALDYLHANHCLTSAELQECIKLSNIFLDTKGCVIIGRNIITDVPDHGQHKITGLDEWLKHRFWHITQAILNDNKSFSFNDWTFVGGYQPAAHIRTLKNYAAFDRTISFPTMSRRLNKLLDAVRGPGQTDALDFRKIRAAMLQTDITMDHIYRPDRSLSVQLGDIGYICHGEFIKLENIYHEVGVEIEHPPLSHISCSSGQFSSTPLGSGLIRHTFKGPIYANVRRFSRNECFVETDTLWKYLARHATRIADEYKMYPDCDITPEDLVLILGIEEDIRIAVIECQSSEDQEVDCEVEFLEHTDLSLNPWGCWSREEAEDVSIRLERFPQNIRFAKLEPSESKTTLGS